jgi:long-subunit fatty acid transport protein
MKTKIFNVFVLIILLVTSLFGQSGGTDVSKRGTSAAAFLSIGQGTRALGMGSAYVAIADDPSALYWNPAGITKVNGVGFIADHTMWIADINYNFLGMSYNLGDLGAIGISFTFSSIDEMKVTTIEQPEGTGETFKVTDAALSFAWAIQLTEDFSIGFNPKFIYQSIWNTESNAIAIDLGVQYVTPFDEMILGMSISNFGTKMQLVGNSELVLYDPDPNTTGNNASIPALLQTDSWELPLNFRIGLAYAPIRSDQHRILLAVDALHVSDNYESVNVGGEYTFNDFFSIRGGYKSLFLQDSEETFSIGAGIKQLLLGNVSLQFDYAYQDFGRLNSVQKFSLSINF